jgi:hypothetical protein
MPNARVPDFDLTRGDALFRLQRRLGLVPASGSGVVRRAAFWTLVGWLPIAAWALATHRALPGEGAEPLMAHFGVHARLLLAVPLLILAEAPANALTARLLRQFIVAGIVSEAGRESYVEAVRRATRWRDAAWPWLVALAIVIALGTYSHGGARSHEIDWAGAGATDPGFGGYWYVYVGRTIFLTLVLSWIWRIALLAGLLARIARLDLVLVPSHADRAGGLAFLQGLPAAFAPLALAVSIVLASQWAHDAVYHGLTLVSVKFEMLLFIALCVAVFSAPLLFFRGPMKRARSQALLDYGALVGRQGELVHARWIDRRPTDDQPLLDAPELGPVADTNALYDAVKAMRTVPLGKSSVMPVVIAAALPLLAVMALQVPVADLLKRLLHAVL